VKPKVIAVIPAREGSTRIHKKNMADFCGLPLIGWTIKAAQEANLFDRIIVSTNSEEISEISRNLGVEVPFLRQFYYDNYSPVSVATISTLDQVKTRLGENYDIVVQLLPTSPLRRGKHIKEAFDFFVKHNHDFLISCSSFGLSNPWWSVRLNEDYTPERLFETAYQSRSQDLETLYCPSGAIWIAKTEKLYAAGTFYGQPHVYYPLDWKTAIDIDDPDDFMVAEAIGQKQLVGVGTMSGNEEI
jgi:CMP-N-acetylneuraminic acid synthetase